MTQTDTLAKQLAERIKLNWEFQLPTSFQDKVKAEQLLEELEKTYVGISKKR